MTVLLAWAMTATGGDYEVVTCAACGAKGKRSVSAMMVERRERAAMPVACSLACADRLLRPRPSTAAA